MFKSYLFNDKAIKRILMCLFFGSIVLFLGLKMYTTKNSLGIISLYNNYPGNIIKHVQNVSEKNNILEKKILLFDALYGHPWTYQFGPDDPGGLKDIGCSTFQCSFTYDKDLAPVMDAIIFNPYSAKEYVYLERSSPDQMWIWMEAEAPFSVGAYAFENFIAFKNFSHNFNWTMTYHSSADLRFHCGYFLPAGGSNEKQIGLTLWETTPDSHMEEYTKYLSSNLSLKGLLKEETFNHTEMKFTKKQFISLINEEIETENHQNKTEAENTASDEDGTKKPSIITWNSFVERPKLVAWMSGHCTTPSNREGYVLELQKYISVDVFGSCGNLTCFKRDPVSIRCWRENLRQNYLFFLSLENTICDEYITEKVFNPLMHGLVPIVWGGANYSRFLPPHSFIDARKYHPKNLAKLLLKLQANKEEYKRYHVWRKFWTVHYGQTFCELCHKLHNVHSYTKTKQDGTNHLNYKRLRDWRLQNEICIEEVQRDLFQGEKWKNYINDTSYS